MASGTIQSARSMKILGFHLSSSGGMHDHVSHISKKFGMRIWAIRNLKRAGVPEKKIVEFHTTAIRPVIEYTAQVYHHMLTGELSERIERLQRIVLKVIYGPETSYREALQQSGLCRLEETRIDLCRKFAIKAEQNPRYKRWFPEADETGHDTRHKKRLMEEWAKMERLFKSPVFGMRRMLNEM